MDCVAIIVHDPTNFCTHCFEHFAIAIIVLVQAQTHEDFGNDGTPTPFLSFVVFLCF
jgi:hypothetical protein